MTDTATIDRPPSGNPDITADAGRAAAEADAGANTRAEPDGGAAKPANPAASDNVVHMPRSGMTPEPTDAAGTSSGESGKRPRCERGPSDDRNTPCAACGQTFTDAKPLSELRINEPDKMHNVVLEIYWATSTFKVYRTARGVFVHFADCGRLEQEQRASFDALYGPLSSLRFLTSRMFRFRAKPSNFYDHEIAQAVVQALHGRVDAAVATLNQLLALAVDRVANENRVRYLLACVAAGLFSGALGALTLWLLSSDLGVVMFGSGAAEFRPYVLAAIMGGLGAVFSIAMSVHSLEMMPCQHSFMNYVFGTVRVLTGFISGAMLILLLTSNLVGDLGQLTDGGAAVQPPGRGNVDWAKVAMLGLLAGFAERLVPDLMSGASSRLSSYREKTADAAAGAAKRAEAEAAAKS